MTKSFNEEIHFDWKVVTASLRTLYRISYLISVYNDMDNYDTERSSIYVSQTRCKNNYVIVVTDLWISDTRLYFAIHLLKIDQGSLSLPHNILLNPEAHPKIIAAYFAYVSGSAKAIRDALRSGGTTDEQIDSDARDVLQFEIELAKVMYF